MKTHKTYVAFSVLAFLFPLMSLQAQPPERSGRPLIGIAYSQATGALFGASTISFTVGAIAWLIAGLALTRGMRAVSRQRLLGVADGI